jgi:hypothetical protein
MTFSHLFLRVDSHNLTSDTVVVAEGMTQMIPGITGMMIRLIGALILLIMMYPMFGYLILPAGLLLLGVNAVFRKILKKLHKQVQETDGNLRIFPQYYGMLASAERIREIEECFLQDLFA